MDFGSKQAARVFRRYIYIRFTSTKIFYSFSSSFFKCKMSKQNKRLKLEALTNFSPRRTRSGKPLGSQNCKGVTASNYFAAEDGKLDVISTVKNNETENSLKKTKKFSATKQSSSSLKIQADNQNKNDHLKKKQTPEKIEENVGESDKVAISVKNENSETGVTVKLEATETQAISVENSGDDTVKDETNKTHDIKNQKETQTKDDNVITTETKENKGSWFPKNWEKQLENIKQMRKNQTAPVDDMGCHKCGDQKASPEVYRFQSLVALMLSSQTKDQVTHAAMQRLKNANCTPQGILAIPDQDLENLLYPVSFYKRKVQYIKKTAQKLIDDYNGDIPRNVKELCDLPGVGPKMAHICMDVAWNEISGIGVDTHVHRISNRLNWVPKPTKTPEQTRVALESWLPKDQWSEVNYLLVGFGQEICQPLRPKCPECLNNKICPFTGKKFDF